REGGRGGGGTGEREEIECHERCGAGGRQLRHARRRGMQAELQEVEVETAGPDDDDLAVHHATLREVRGEREPEVGKVTVERPQVAALGVDVITGLEGDGTEAVPLRLEEPAVPCRQIIRALYQHRLDGRVDREACRVARTARV